MRDISVSDPETHTESKVSAYVDVRANPSHPSTLPPRAEKPSTDICLYAMRVTHSSRFTPPPTTIASLHAIFSCGAGTVISRGSVGSS